MRDGTRFEHAEDYAARMHDYPSREELEAKFWDQFNAFGKLPRATGEKIIRTAARLEELEDMREYTSLLTV